MANKRVVNRKVRIGIQQLIREAYKYGGKYVEEGALLQRNLRNLFSYLDNTSLEQYPRYPKPNELYHRVSTDSIGTFCATICRDNEMNPILFIKNWDFKINPHVYSNLYQLLVTLQSVYDVICDGGCGFAAVPMALSSRRDATLPP